MSEQHGEGVYRETVDRIGGNEREEEAVRVLGRWRDRTKTIVLALFGVLGVVPGAFGYRAAQAYQFEHNGGVAFTKLSVLVAAAVWFVMFMIGTFVSRRVVRARTAAKIAELSAAYAIPAESLQQIVAMVEKL